MKNARRTFITCVGYAGLIGCVLVGDAALASTRNGTIWVRDVRASAVEQALGGTHVRVNTRTSYITADGNIRRYGSPSVLVARPTLRQGALALLKRGVMHPGFQLALLAAGFIVNDDNEVMVPDESQVDLGNLLDPDRRYTVSERNAGTNLNNWNTYYNNCVTGGYWTGLNVDLSSVVSRGGFASGAQQESGDRICLKQTYGGYYTVYRVTPSTNAAGQTLAEIGYQVEPQYRPAVDSDYEQADPHIPVDIVQDLYGNSFAIPQWQEAISVMGQPATDVQSNGQLMPEIADAVGKWGKNIADKLNGDEPSYPDAPDHSRDAQEEYYDCQLENCDGGDDGGGTDWEEPIPPFEEPEIKWQTEILTLPDWSSGIGSGSCPGSRSIPMPLGGGSLDIDYQPACDLATMVRPALIGTCGFIALLIVVRARGGA